MPKTSKATEPVEEKTVDSVKDAEASGEAMISIPASQWENMQSQMAMVMQKLSSEEREKEVKDKTRAEEERLIEYIKKTNEAAMERVRVHVEKGSRKSNKNAEVSLNGTQFTIPKGVDVMVPRAVKEVLDNAEKQELAADGLQEKKAAEWEKDSLLYEGTEN